MAGRYDMYSKGSSGWTISMRNEEFQEDEVWAVFKERKDFNSRVDSSKEFSNISPRPLPSAARMIPRPSSSPLESKMAGKSAPVNIPDWSKIYGNHCKMGSKNSAWLDHGYDDEDARRGSDSDEDSIVDGEDESHKMMPPHEWIAKKVARGQISSFSVCEGAGRTLKGRDLSRVRNSVLTRTGFLE